MVEDGIEWSVVITSLTLLIAIHGVLAYTTRRIIINRHALHIANRNLFMVLTETTLISSGLCCILIRWILLALKARQFYGAFVIFCKVWISPGAVMLAATSLFKVYLVVIKFREAGASVKEDGFVARLMRWIRLDMRTTRGQNRYLLGVWMACMASFIVVLTSGEHFCLRLCKDDLPVYGAYWMYPVAPSGAIALPLIMRVVLELIKLCPINESLGLLQELRDLCFFAGPFISLGNATTILLDIGLIPKRYAYVSGICWLLAILNVFYISQFRLCSPYGYGLSHKNGLKKVAPLLRGKTKGSSPDLSAASRTTTERVAGTRSPSDSSGSSEAYMGLLTGLALDATVQDELFRSARGLLSEEAVRWAVAILNLQTIKTDKESRAEFRTAWTRIIEVHLTEGCPYPVSIVENDRKSLCALVGKVCRRKVLFKDDCELVNEYFMTVLGQLGPTLKPVVKAHCYTAFEQEGAEQPTEGRTGATMPPTKVPVDLKFAPSAEVGGGSSGIFSGQGQAGNEAEQHLPTTGWASNGNGTPRGLSDKAGVGRAVRLSPISGSGSVAPHDG